GARFRPDSPGARRGRPDRNLPRRQDHLRRPAESVQARSETDRGPHARAGRTARAMRAVGQLLLPARRPRNDELEPHSETHILANRPGRRATGPGARSDAGNSARHRAATARGPALAGFTFVAPLSQGPGAPVRAAAR